MKYLRFIAIMLFPVMLTFTACGGDSSGEDTPPTVINISAITGVTAPVLGAIPATTITATDQYTGTVTWDGGWAWSNRFGGQKAYTATITLTAKSGYTLTGVAANFFTIAGTSTIATNSANSGIITAVFPATASVGNIGDSALGGKVAYILQSGDTGFVAGEQRGLIAAVADQDSGSGKVWYNGSYTITGATGILLGTGQANTIAIVNNQGAGSYAAQLCNDYENTDTGTGIYTDWYLPSKDELYKLYLNRISVGGFSSSSIYWSSSEYDTHNAFCLHFNNGGQYTGGKNTESRVRAARTF